MSSIRTLNRPGMMIEGSSVNVIPGSSGVSSSVEMKGGPGGAARPQLVPHCLRQLDHRHAADADRRHRLHGLFDRDDRSSHSVELFRRLDTAETVYERGAGPEPVGAGDTREIEHR